METNLIENILEKETGLSGVVEKLSNTQPASFQSLLLDILERRADQVWIGDINSSLKTNPYVKMCEVDQKSFLKFDLLAYDLLPKEYQSIELSPLLPFSSNQLLADINQKRIFSTTRNAEIVSDPTMALALHLAQSRSECLKQNSKSVENIAMATSHRVIRQEKPKKSWYTTHFRNFTVWVTWRDTGSESFEKKYLEEHLVFFLRLIKNLNETHEYNIKNPTVTLLNANKNKKESFELTAQYLIERLLRINPDLAISVCSDKNSNYYSSLWYSICAENKSGQIVNIAWWGLTNWTQKLLWSTKERLLVGSIGSEILAKLFTS